MSNMHLYPVVKVDRQDFSKEKSITVPNQNLSLRDIILRFLRKETLPVDHEGTYQENLGDLEKLQHEDITVRKEKAAHIRSRLRAVEKHHADLSKKAVDAPPPGGPPLGDVTGAPAGGGQAPPPSPPITKT